jgi:ubiquinone/menaquinone biosynthesis C-methylase UbiE
VRAGSDLIAQEYFDRMGGSRSRGEVLAQADRHIAAVRERVPRGGKVIDLGCGAGVPFTRALAEDFDVTGVDFSARQLELAREHVPHAHFVQADMTEVEFPAASVDAVTAFFSIFHVRRELHSNLFSNIARWLRPGGIFLATLGTKDRAEDWEDGWLGAPRMFWSYFTPEDALRHISTAGLEVEKAELETVQDGIDGPETFFWVLVRKPV